MKNHLANPLVNARYMNSEDLARVERRVVEFFCAGTGGAEIYTGKDMVATHKGMNINEQEFMSVIDDAMDALQKNDIDEATRNEVLANLCVQAQGSRRSLTPLTPKFIGLTQHN